MSESAVAEALPSRVSVAEPEAVAVFARMMRPVSALRRPRSTNYGVGALVISFCRLRKYG